MITNYREILTPPRTVSQDMYVRLTATDIVAMELTYLYSETIGEASSARPIGITEWTGMHGKHILSIAWDWIVLNDGIFLMPPNCVIRTNLMLVDGYGYDTDIVTTDRVCTKKIGTLGWQNVLQKMKQNREIL